MAVVKQPKCVSHAAMQNVLVLDEDFDNEDIEQAFRVSCPQRSRSRRSEESYDELDFQ